MFDKSATYIIYDGDCPFCTKYVQLLRLRQSVGPIVVLNAREDHEGVAYAKCKGIDLNHEMALIFHGEVYGGAECLHRLALMSTGSGLFNAFSARVFSSPRLARFLYPFLRTGRNTTLRILGRSPISM